MFVLGETEKKVIFQNTNGKIYNEDCIKVMGEMPKNSVHLIVTDPPYLMNYKSGFRKKDHEYASAIKGDNDPTLIENYVEECHKILKENSAMYMFCNFNKVDFFKQVLEKEFNVKNMIIWVKNGRTAGDLKAAFARQYEIMFLCNKGRRAIVGKRITDVWSFDKVSGKAQMHQNQKPIELIKQCIEKHSRKGNVIFDGFMGSGTTMVAADELGRKWIGIEKEKKYCQRAISRLKKGTGSGDGVLQELQAVLENSQEDCYSLGSVCEDLESVKEWVRLDMERRI